MMWGWFGHGSRMLAAEVVESLAGKPTGGILTFILLGIVLPTTMIAVGVATLVFKQAFLIDALFNPSRNEIPAIGVAWIGSGLFAHFQFFWHLHPSPKLYEWADTGKMLSGFVVILSVLYIGFRVIWF